MTESEYPDTTWVGLPRAYGNGRDGKSVKLSIVHYTAGRAGPGQARAGAAYDKRRTDGTSCHCFHDNLESVQEVWTKDRANAAFAKGNRLGIQHELCATNVSRDWWLNTPIGYGTLVRGANAVAWDCRTYGLQPRRLTVSEVRATWNNYPHAPGGICGHVDITNAFEGDHTDPGPQFPWDAFEQLVQAKLYVPTTGRKGRNTMIVYKNLTKNEWALTGTGLGASNWIEISGTPATGLAASWASNTVSGKIVTLDQGTWDMLKTKYTTVTNA